MTEHDLIDAERLAEQRRRDYAPSGWREEINSMADAILKLVAEVRRQRSESTQRLAQEISR
jgi:hypothetical protein